MPAINLTKNKYFVSLLFSLLCVTSVFGQKTDWQRDNLKGKVKSVSFYTNSKLTKKRSYNLNGSETSLKNYCPDNISSICSHDSSIFDQRGNMVKYIDDNFIIEKKCDSTGNLIESIQSNKVSTEIVNKSKFYYVNLKKVRSEQTNNRAGFNIVIDYSYDANGNLSEEKNTSTRQGITTKGKIIYKYDQEQNLIEKTESDNDGRMQYSYIYKYDSNKRKIEYQSRSFNGSSYTNYNEYFKYDENGRLLESSHYELNGNELYKDANTFDKEGNRIKKSHYYHDKLMSEIADTYNSAGYLTEELEFQSGVLALKKTFIYDTTGNMITALHTDPKGIVKTKLDYKISYY
jgi:hypothetical protein